MRVLLHTCCGPCLIYPQETLRNKGFEVESYFYNPNIYPEDEFFKRRSACIDLASFVGLKINISEYRQEDFYRTISSKDAPARCLDCWRLRLLKTAEFAKENNFDSFTTTLLVSPYQDQNALRDIGHNIAQDNKIDFYYEDFRPGFKYAHDKAKAQGVYCQKYCGCMYSRSERYKNRIKNV